MDNQEKLNKLMHETLTSVDLENLERAKSMLKTTDMVGSLPMINAHNVISNERKEINDLLDESYKEKIRKDEERESREKRNLQINEQKLEIEKFKIFLLQSVTRDQKEMLEKLESLIDCVMINGKIEESNLLIIQQELLEIKQSTDNLNESFVKFIEKKMIEMGVEAAVKYFFIGIKFLFLSQSN